MRVRCPHCRNPIELVDDISADKISCPTCGSNFSLLGTYSTKAYPDITIKSLGHFELRERLGIGAFGAVWKAYDSELDRIVALKIPRKEQLSGQEAELFLREARAAAQLQHPNIVSVHEVGREEDHIYIVSDFVDGLTLTDWLTGQKPTFREAAQLCAQIAEAIQHAHEHGVIHRDLKPGNIMLDHDGNIHIMDFGLAKREVGEITMTIDGLVLGTPAYMSPEQARGDGNHLDRRADVYSLGVILFELLTGEPPFRGSTRMLLHQVLHEPAPSPRRLNSLIPKDLETICLKATDKEPSRRYQSAADFAADLHCFLEHKPIAARPISGVEHLWRWCVRNPRIAFLLLLLFASLLTGTIVSSYYGYQAVQSRDQVTQHLYRSLMNTIDATRAARGEGYREKIEQLVKEIRQLPSSVVDTDEVCLKYVAAMGDFVGFAPTDLNSFSSPVNIFALSRTGTFAAIGLEGGLIEIVEIASGKSVEQFKLPDVQIRCLEFVGENDDLVAVFANGVKYSWHRVSSSWVANLPSEMNLEIERCAISPDKRRCAAVVGNEMVTWGEADPDNKVRFALEAFEVIGTAISPNGELLAASIHAASEDDYGVVIWNLKTQSIVYRQQFEYGSTYANGIAFGPDSRHLCIAFEQALIVLETEKFQQVMNQRVDAIIAVAFSPIGDLLATDDIRGSITIWTLASQRQIAQLRHPRKATSDLQIRFSDDGSLLAASNSSGVRAWRLDQADERLESDGHRGGVPCAVFLPDSSSCLVTGGKDSKLNWWNADTGELLHEAELPGPPQSLAISPNKKHLAVAFWGSNPLGINIYDINTRELLLQFEHSVVAACSVCFLESTSEDEQLAISGLEGTSIVRIKHDPQNGNRITAEEVFHQNGSRCLHIDASTSDKRLAWVQEDRDIVLWDLGENRRIKFGGPTMNQGWHGLAFVTNSDSLVYVSDQAKLTFWDVSANSHWFELDTKMQFTDPHLAVNLDGTLVAAMLEPTVVSVWDIAKRKLRYEFRPERASVWSLAWSPESDKLGVGLSDGGVAIWRIEKIEEKLKQAMPPASK